MSEKLCLQWNDFKDNAIGAFASLSQDKDFADEEDAAGEDVVFFSECATRFSILLLAMVSQMLRTVPTASKLC